MLCNTLDQTYWDDEENKILRDHGPGGKSGFVSWDEVALHIPGRT